MGLGLNLKPLSILSPVLCCLRLANLSNLKPGVPLVLCGVFCGSLWL